MAKRIPLSPPSHFPLSLTITQKAWHRSLSNDNGDPAASTWWLKKCSSFSSDANSKNDWRENVAAMSEVIARRWSWRMVEPVWTKKKKCKNPEKCPRFIWSHHLKIKILMNISLLFCCPSPRLFNTGKKKVPAFITKG